MNDDDAIDQAPSQEDKPTEPVSAGRLLRQSREATGLHIAALAVSLKVSVKKLEALEADRYDLLPDAVFVRGLASSVCRVLKIAPTEVLSLLPQTSVPALKPDESGINMPFRAPGDVHGVSVVNQLSKPVVLAALVLLCGALVLIFFPSVNQVNTVTEVSSGSTTLASIAQAPSAEPASANQISPAVPAASLIPQSVDAAVSGKTESSESLVSTPVRATSPVAVAAPITDKPSESGLLVITTRSSSWVEVTDAKGLVQLRKTVQPGETVGLSGVLPLSVVVGRADVTDVLVRGKSFNLASIAKDNVARFEVK